MALVWCFLRPPSCLQKSLLRPGDSPRPALCLRLQKSLPPSYITHLGPPPVLSESESCSVASDSLRPHGLYSPCNSPGQNTRVCNLLQGIFPTQGSNSRLLCLLQVDSLPAEPSGKPGKLIIYYNSQKFCPLFLLSQHLHLI